MRLSYGITRLSSKSGITIIKNQNNCERYNPTKGIWLGNKLSNQTFHIISHETVKGIIHWHILLVNHLLSFNSFMGRKFQN